MNPITRTGCCWYHKGTIFQANHNVHWRITNIKKVVVDTTKVQFFKQITTVVLCLCGFNWLLLIPQRYNFSSKSQLKKQYEKNYRCCCWYHKGTIFQANHNSVWRHYIYRWVVVDTTKVQFFKQITTAKEHGLIMCMLLLIPQRYNFSSKSQR